LRAAAAGPGHGNAVGIDFRQGEKEVERANGVQRLQPHDALEVRLGLRAEQAPILDRVHLGPLPGKPMHQLDAHGLETAAPAFFKAFLTVGNFAEQFGVARFGKARVGPMPMREEHSRHPAVDLGRTIKISRDEQTRGAFEIDFFHRVLSAIDPAVNHRVKRRFGRHGPEPLRDQDLAADAFGARSPLGLGSRRREWKVTVEVFWRLNPDVIGHAPRRQDTRGLGVKRGRKREKDRQSTPEGGRESRGHELERRQPPASCEANG
jgi:hypothetical protein